MKRVLFCMLLLAGCNLSAQTTHNLDWFMGISMAEASLEIDEGDTVIWTLTDAPSHTVTSDTGSVETFDSGNLNSGSTYSHTFTAIGDNPYFCVPHPNMKGVITVHSLGVEEKSIRNFVLSPNPVSMDLHLTLPDQVENVRAIVYDVSGKMVLNQEINALDTTISTFGWSAGIYMIKVGNGNISTTKRFIKN